MKRLFEIAAGRDAQIKVAILGTLGRAALGAITSPVRTLGYVGAAADTASSARKAESIADEVAQNVARAPRPSGPTY